MKIERNESTEQFFSVLNGVDMEMDPDMDYSIAIDKIEEYRGRGSTFYVEYIIEIGKDTDGFGDIDITPYIGVWKTNRIIEDAEYGTDDTFDELTSVTPKDTVTTEWLEVA